LAVFRAKLLFYIAPRVDAPTSKVVLELVPVLFVTTIGIYTSISFISIQKKNKDKMLILFSSPQPSPSGEGARDKCNPLLFIDFKLEGNRETFKTIDIKGINHPEKF